MTNVWQSDPHFKIEVGSTTYTDDQAFTIEVTRPENNISSCVMTLNDYKNKNFLSVFSPFTAIDISMKYGSDSWTKIFTGHVFQLRPTISSAGEFLTVNAWGKEYGLAKTFCDTSWGTESRRNHAITTVTGIFQDVIDHYVNDSFNDAAKPTNWNLGYDILDGPMAGLTITYLNSNYMNCISVLNRVCDLASAYAQGLGQAGMHWYVDTSQSVRFKQISASTIDNEWTRYWNDALTTLTVDDDMILYDFQKTMEGYTNDVVLSTAFRMPAEDYWTEGHGTDWGHSANLAHNDDNDPCIVGSTSLQWTPNDDAASYIYYPSAQNAAWDFTKVGSALHPPTLSYYAREENGTNFTPLISLCHDAAKYFVLYGSSNLSSDDRWEHFSFPMGSYHEIHIDSYRDRWQNVGGANWNDINYLRIDFGGLCNGKSFWMDDLHFSGSIVRRAYDSDAWATYNDQQKIVLNDTAVSDVLVAATDTGTAARLAYAELLRGMAMPTVGIIQTPLIANILPGHQLHIHACKKADGTYRIDKDAANNDDVWRVTELRHLINSQGFTTQLNLTNDDQNSLALGAPTLVELMQEYAGALGQKEAKDLKGGALDNLIQKLEKDY